MDHPHPENLIEFLYGELAPAPQAEVAWHLEMCEECRSQLASWGQVRDQLQTWELPRSVATRRGRFSPTRELRWAAAAVVLLGVGFGLARLSSPGPPDLAQMRAEITRELRGEITQQLTADFSKFASDQLAQQQIYQRAIADAVRQFESRQVADYVSLRRDVETVAIRSQERFDQLADVAQTEATAPSLDR